MQRCFRVTASSIGALATGAFCTWSTFAVEVIGSVFCTHAIAKSAAGGIANTDNVGPLVIIGWSIFAIATPFAVGGYVGKQVYSGISDCIKGTHGDRQIKPLSK
jgi:hypothetical protein